MSMKYHQVNQLKPLLLYVELVLLNRMKHVIVRQLQVPSGNRCIHINELQINENNIVIIVEMMHHKILVHKLIRRITCTLQEDKKMLVSIRNIMDIQFQQASANSFYRTNIIVQQNKYLINYQQILQ